MTMAELKQVSDKAVTNFQNPWCLFVCDYRNDETCEALETGNCFYETGKSNWPLDSIPSRAADFCEKSEVET